MSRRAVLLAAVLCVGCGGHRAATHTRAVTAHVPLPPNAQRVQTWHMGGLTLVAWRYRARHVPWTAADDRYALVAGRPTHTILVRDSPFPIAGDAVRFADVTRDGRPDLLLTLLCDVCNHASATASIFSDTGGGLRRVYGWGFLGGSKNGHVGVHGRVIVETPWGAWHGLVWFDQPSGGQSVCCPTFRLRTFLRWDGERLHVIRRQRVRPERDDFLGQRPVPAP